VTNLPALAAARLTEHSREQMAARDVAEDQIRAVLSAPEAVIPVRAGRVVAQRIIPRAGADRPMLLRVFVDVDRSPAEVVTAYWTSRVEKYRNHP
jgi:hypothetical protein